MQLQFFLAPMCTLVRQQLALGSVRIRAKNFQTFFHTGSAFPDCIYTISRCCKKFDMFFGIVIEKNIYIYFIIKMVSLIIISFFYFSCLKSKNRKWFFTTAEQVIFFRYFKMQFLIFGCLIFLFHQYKLFINDK